MVLDGTMNEESKFKKDTLYKKCPGCDLWFDVKHFSRVSRHSGLVEKGFVYCNDCVNY